MGIEMRVKVGGKKSYRAVCRKCHPRKLVGTFHKRADAVESLAEHTKAHKIRQGTNLTPISVRKAYEEWMIKKSVSGIGQSQVNRIKQHFGNILPHFGRMMLTEVTETELVNLRIKLQKTPTKSTGRPLANRTIRAMETIFKGFLKDLTGQTNSHRLTYDPLAHVKSIKVRDIAIKKEEPFTEEEREKLITSAWNYTEKEKFKVWYLRPFLALNTGARVGELHALQIRDFDFNAKLLSIERTAWRPSGTTTPKVKPGTKNGKIRTISITDNVVNEVKSHIKWMEMYWKWYVKKPLTDEQYILFDPRDLGPIHFGASESRFMTLLRQTGLNKYGRSFKSLRHTHATWLLSEGETLDRVAHRLGHSSTDITYRYYRTFIPKDHDAVRAKLEQTEVRR